MLNDFISGEKFQALCDFEWQPGQELPDRSGLLYVCGDYIGSEMLRQRLHQSKHEFILLSHNSDVNMEQEWADSLPDNVLHWFSQNMNAYGNKVSGLPIGIANSKWPHGNVDGMKEGMLTEPCLGHGYWCCKVDTNPSVRNKWLNKILELQNHINITIDQWPVPRQRCLDMYRQHVVSFSPPGNGLDCHRHWEILMVGGVPIIERSAAMSHFGDLPILWIDGPDDLTAENLAESYQTLLTNIGRGLFMHRELLTFSYWKNLILSTKAGLLS